MTAYDEKEDYNNGKNEEKLKDDVGDQKEWSSLLDKEESILVDNPEETNAVLISRG